jgi:hypothetical protein
MTEATLMTEATNTTEGQASTTTETSTTVAPETSQTQQATQSQTTDAVKAEGAKTEGETAAAPPGAPEKYELTLPEGVTMDESGLTSFSELAKDLNLTQDAAQAMLAKMAPAMQARQADVKQAAMAEWGTQSKGDAEFGGAKLTENVALAEKALKQFGTPELSTLLKESGLGNHPEIIRAFYRAGKAISEDGSFVNGATKGAGNESAAQRMYPNMNP